MRQPVPGAAVAALSLNPPWAVLSRSYKNTIARISHLQSTIQKLTTAGDENSKLAECASKRDFPRLCHRIVLNPNSKVHLP
mmetsp:Transcript_12856/g.51416  ORF Transcript_12856/g.51416 Transcript_12856/m.51416 type:complete len:81 (-) Transcript_12856:9-251(-)